MNKKNQLKNGFTLIEILIVMGLIAILAAVVLVAVNPARQFAQGRNTQRMANASTILSAIGQNIADNKGKFVCGAIAIPTAAADIAKTGSSVTAPAGALDLRSCLSPVYVSELPVDPEGGAACADSVCAAGYDTKYSVEQDASGRVKVCAPNAANETSLGTGQSPICVTR